MYIYASAMAAILQHFGYIYMQHAGWALTEGQHRPKAGKKKKTREAGLFFLVPTSY